MSVLCSLECSFGHVCYVLYVYRYMYETTAKRTHSQVRYFALSIFLSTKHNECRNVNARVGGDVVWWIDGFVIAHDTRRSVPSTRGVEPLADFDSFVLFGTRWHFGRPSRPTNLSLFRDSRWSLFESRGPLNQRWLPIVYFPFWMNNKYYSIPLSEHYRKVG